MARRPVRKELQALEAAQAVAYDAWNAAGARRLALAEKALALSPLCADAHVILAHAAPNAAAALPRWRQAVAAGEAAIGPAGMKAMEGEFWGWLETRPYMRALMGLAHALRETGAVEESIAIGRRMLVLNPNDNQGVRHVLLGWVMAEGRDAEAQALIDAYPEDGMALWPWTRALLAFRAQGDGTAAQALLDAAIAANPHVAPFLIGTKRMPRRQAAYYSWGEPSEAQLVVTEIGPAWMLTPGAITWLKACQPPRRRPSAVSRKPPPL
jgi:tetratricopeptide (TPR) repeat protein